MWPGHIKAGVEVNTLACTSDYLPTLAGWLQLPLPAEHQLDGVDLRPAMFAAARGEPAPRQQAIGFESARMATWTSDRFKLVAHLKGHGLLPQVDRVELFDLLEDPEEQTNAAADHPDTVAAMRESLARWRVSIRQRT